jgi:Zn-dependent protease with chaperone function
LTSGATFHTIEFDVKILISVLLSSVVHSLFATQVARAQCRDWTEVLAESFLSRMANPAALKHFSMISLEEYRNETATHERQGVQELISRAVAHSPTLLYLKSHLRQFYATGAQLYGIQLDPEQIYILPDLDLNAFATGGHIFFYEGILLYYLDPIQFLVRTGAVPRNMTREAYAQVAHQFNWRNDWDSIYFVLAHEAAHNLMAHGDEQVVEGMRTQLQRLASDARAHRKAIAEGRSSTGVKHYLGQSLLAFLSGPERSRQRVAQEEEADAVASDILRRVGLRLHSGVVWLQRMFVLQGPSATGWRSVLNSLFCSTHPDMQQRISSLQRNVSCLQYRGELCEKHVSYPIPDRLQLIGSGFADIEQYLDQTLAIAEGRLKPQSDVRQTVEIKPNPKRVKLFIDGAPVEAGKIVLPVGPHVLTATADGYHGASITFAVFPDVKATLKVKLKKCDKRKPCYSEPLEIPQSESLPPSAIPTTT